jgi:RNA polymerase sigma factor (sigma-70 family)
MEKTDYELVSKCLKGNNYSFEELVARYKKLVFSIVYKFVKDTEEVNDLSQEVFLRLYRVLGKYNPEYKFSTWIAKITTNLCLDYLRKKKKSCIPIEEIENYCQDPKDAPEEICIKKDEAARIQKAIDELPEMYRTPIVLYHQKGMSYKEIAAYIDKPMSIVKNRIFRARNTLKQSLEGINI